MKKRKIYIPPDNNTLSFASLEFTRYVQKCTGEELFSGNNRDDCEFVFDVLNDTDAAKMPEEIYHKFLQINYDGFLAGVYNGKTYVLAKEARGVLFGIYKLLELECGIVFAAPEQEFIPIKRLLSFKKPLQLYNPEFELRGIGLHNGWYKVDWLPMLDWMTKRGFNCLQIFLNSYKERREKLFPELLKRDTIVDAGAHSAFYFLPPEKYLEKYPEYYSRKSDGTLIGKHLCYAPSSQKEDEYAANIISFIESHPEVKIVSLWPEDGGGRCECEKCVGQLGTLVPEFVNRITDKITEKYPRIMVNHLAYSVYTAPPKNIKFNKNLFVNHCDYWDRIINRPINDYRQGSPELHPPEEHQEAQAAGRKYRNHKDICEELQAWREKCKTTVFSYYSDLEMKRRLLTDVSNTICDDLKYYKRAGIIGYIDCCCYPQDLTASIFNLFALGNYSWASHMDRKEMLECFAEGFCGPGTVSCIVKFYNALDDIVNKNSTLGFNTVDLLHRSPHEVAFFSGIRETLITATISEFANGIKLMKEALEEAEKVPENFRKNITELKMKTCDLELRFKMNFYFYAAEAFLDQNKNENAKAALNNALIFYKEHKEIFKNEGCGLSAEKTANFIASRINQRLDSFTNKL